MRPVTATSPTSDSEQDHPALLTRFARLLREEFLRQLDARTGGHHIIYTTEVLDVVNDVFSTFPVAYLACGGLTLGDTPAVPTGFTRELELWTSRLSRELAVLRLLADGIRTKDMATRLGRSEESVKATINDIMARLGGRTLAHAVATGFRLGLLGDLPAQHTGDAGGIHPAG